MKTLAKRQTVRNALIIGAFILFPVVIFYFSPALVVMGAAAGVVSGSAISFGCQFVSALVLGRAFCGWVCPAAGLQEACFIAQSKRVNGRKCDWIKYAIWFPWIAAIVLLFIRNGIREIDILFKMDSPVSLTSPAHYIIYICVTTLVFVLSLTLGKRGFCHAGCWMAPFMVAGTKLQHHLHLPALHLRSEASKCVSCNDCTSQCPMSLEVTDMVKQGDMRHSECILCGNCVDVCGKKAISYAFGITMKGEKPST